MPSAGRPPHHKSVVVGGVRFGAHNGLKSEIAPEVAEQRKSRPKAALNSILMIKDHAVINAGLGFLRYTMKPRPAKPRNIMAHVEGSGTALNCPRISPDGYFTVCMSM